MTAVTNLVADFVKLLCWEWAFAYTGAVCLYNAENPVNFLRSNAGTYADTARNRMGCCNVWISTIVNIKHGCLSTLEKNLAAFIYLIVQEGNGVAYIRTETLNVAHVLIVDFIKIQRLMVVKSHQLLIFQLKVVLKLAGKFIPIKKIAYTNADTVHLVHVARANAVLGGTNLVGSTSLIADTVHDAMIRHYHMCTVGNADTGNIDTTGCHCIHFLKGNFGIYYNAVTDNTVCSLVQNTGREKTELIFLAIYCYCMAGIAAALITYNCLSLLCEKVYDFTLTLIAPLSACYYNC